MMYNIMCKIIDEFIFFNVYLMYIFNVYLFIS